MKHNLFINLSNHPSASWSEVQLKAAAEYGNIADLPFPLVKEDGDEKYIEDLANSYLQKVEELSEGIPCTVHLMGELNFTFALVNKLKAMGYNCIASTTKRNVTELPDGSKKVVFEFCRFRKY